MKQHGYNETRRINFYDLRALCIRNNWFTHANCQQYNDFLTKAKSIKNITTDDLVELATDVMEYSDTDGMECEDIMWELNNACTFMFSRDED